MSPMLILFASIEFINIMHLLLYYFLLHVNYFVKDWLTYTQDVYHHWYCCCCLFLIVLKTMLSKSTHIWYISCKQGFQINLSNNPDIELISPRIFLYDINFSFYKFSPKEVWWVIVCASLIAQWVRILNR